MQRELKDNTNFETNAGPPLPPAAHFDLKRIEAAKPVEPLPDNRRLKMRSAAQRVFGGRVGLFAIVSLTVLIIVGIAASFTALRPAQQSAKDTSLSGENTFAESATPESAPVSTERPQTRSRSEPSHRRNRRMVREFETIDVLDGQPNGKPKARLVTVIHRDHVQKPDRQ